MEMSLQKVSSIIDDDQEFVDQSPLYRAENLNGQRDQDQEMDDGQIESSTCYRLVRKNYYCFVCQKNKKKMMSVQDFEEWGLQCDECGQGFCEILDQDNKDLTQELKDAGKVKIINEEETPIVESGMLGSLQAANELAFMPPKVTSGKRENVKDTNIECDAQGRPLGQVVPQQQRQQPEEEKKQSEQQPQRRRVVIVQGPSNPYSGFGNFMGDFFQEIAPQQQQMRPQQQFQQRPQQAQQSQSNMEDDPNEIFNSLFRPLQLTSMFNDNNVRQMPSNFDSFNPHEFGMNYNQNFRSSRMPRPERQFSDPNDPMDSGLGFFQSFRQQQPRARQQRQYMSFDDFVTMLAQRMSEQQEGAPRNPTSEETIARIPLVTIDDKHCKKKEDGTVEKPTCSVCITDFEKGDKSLILPCGHLFHPDCIKPWLKDNNTCPVCRKQLP